ncbi:MAG: O-antigen ligase family protein [Gammaproteobacteria bacterium]
MTAVLAIYAALCLSTLLQPATAIAGAFCMFGFELWAQASVPYFTSISGRPLINKLIGAIVVLGLLRKIFGGHPILRGYPVVGWVVFALFFYALVSTLWAPNPARSLSAFLGQAPYIIIIVFLCPLLCSGTADFERMFVATFVLGTVLALLLMFTVDWQGRGVALPGTYVSYKANPLATGQLGGTIAIIAAFLSWPKFRLLNILKWIVVVLGLVMAIRSGSRGQTLALVVVIFACWPIAHRLHDFKAYVMLAFVAALIVAASFWGLDTYWADSDRWSEDALDRAREDRLHFSSQMLDYWFKTVATMFFGLGSSASVQLTGNYSHIAPVDILTEEGILGILIYVGIIWICLKNGLSSFSLVRYNPVQRTQFAILCAIFVYNFLLSLKQGTFLGSTVLFMAAILIGKYQKALLHHHRRLRVIERDHSPSITDLR